MYGNIKESDLDTPCILDDYELRTLRENIDNLCLDEDIIYADYRLYEEENIGRFCLSQFIAWTDNYVIVLYDDPLNNTYLTKIHRNPPKKFSF